MRLLDRYPLPDGVPPAPRRWWYARSAGVLAVMLFVLYLSVGPSAPQTPLAGLVLLTVLSWLPLLLRHRLPGVALGGAVLVESVHLVVLEMGSGSDAAAVMAAYQPVPIATMVGVYAYARWVPARRGWTVGLTAGVLLGFVALLTQPLALLATDMVVVNLVAIATAVGVATSTRRERAARAERDRQEDVRRGVQGERLRIARELHDVLAHHLTLVNAQAGVAEYLLRSDTDAAETALRGIAQHTRQALDEVRATVGLLRQDGESDPSSRVTVSDVRLPTVVGISQLVDEARSSGQDATFVADGAPGAVDAAVDVAGYRIVQEALTNAARHAPGAAVQVHVRWSRTAVELVVDNEPTVRPEPSRLGGGHGVLGMRERAAAAGGEVDVGPREDGGYRVRALLPTSPTVRAG